MSDIGERRSGTAKSRRGKSEDGERRYIDKREIFTPRRQSGCAPMPKALKSERNERTD